MIDEESSALEDDLPSARTGSPASLSTASRADFTLGSAV